MIEGSSQTTEREESGSPTAVNRLALEWVWPTSRRAPLQGAKLSLGRDVHSALPIAAKGVSRHHAELYRQGPIYVIRDLQSTNGTWLNGRRVQHAPVAAGSVLRLGDCVGIFVAGPDEAIPFTELAPGLLGGAAMATAIEQLKRAGETSLPVLLVGETGTGKERVARATHYFSRREGPFIAVNCAALPEQLAEAELFGYRRGAFTGAERASLGHFRAAHGGTLFLDEMPELSPALQAKLLRVLEDGQVTGLGESTPVTVDVRVVSASQHAVRDLVASGRLRRDLAARLNGLEVRLPPLSERRTDVAPLFARFLQKQSGGRPPAVEGRVVEALCLHSWPDNVRELELVTRRLLAVHGHEATLRRAHLPAELAALTEHNGSSVALPALDRQTHELGLLQNELARNGGNVKAAALALGISRQRAYRLLETAPSKEGADGHAVGE